MPLLENRRVVSDEIVAVAAVRCCCRYQPGIGVDIGVDIGIGIDVGGVVSTKGLISVATVDNGATLQANVLATSAWVETSVASAFWRATSTNDVAPFACAHVSRYLMLCIRL